MRALVACALLVGCGFTGPTASNAPTPASPDAPLLTLLDAPTVTTVDAAAGGPDAGLLPDAPPPPPMPFVDCLAAYQAGIRADGPQMIDPDGAGGKPPFTAYCNMTQSGGGWTLAYAYHFADPQHFDQGSNAITPRPTWPLMNTTSNVPTSTTPPASELDPNAIDFAIWPKLGPAFLVTSNINNWITCTPGTGGLTAFTAGSISCTVVHAIASSCQTTAPSKLSIQSYGPLLYVGMSIFNTYYYFEGSTSGTAGDWPTHDPCGSNNTYPFQATANARGAVYLRRQ